MHCKSGRLGYCFVVHCSKVKKDPIRDAETYEKAWVNLCKMLPCFVEKVSNVRILRWLENTFGG